MSSNNDQESLVPKEAENKLCWYVLHTYSGYENKVMDTLKKSVENSEKMQKLIFEIVVPEEEVTEIKKGKRVKSRRKVYPGYVMIHMIWTTESWYLVRNTRGVTGFVGPESKPVALSDDEVERMLNPVPEDVKADIAIGQDVRVLSGSFENFTVKVIDVDAMTGTVRVEIPILGRKQEIELPIEDVEKIED